MDPVMPLSQKWPGTQALMLVHGVGDYKPGDYDDLLQSLAAVLGPETWHDIAVYPFFYDFINDWMVQKTQLKSLVQPLASEISSRLPGEPNPAGLDDAFSEGVADVLWPGFLRDARLAIRDALVQQVQQIVFDGRASNVPRWSQRITILCHSLGCVHTYELLHAAASNPIYQLRPASEWVRFSNVIMFASPVQLYQSVGLSDALRPFIIEPEEMAVFNGPVRMPGQVDQDGDFTSSVKRFVSLTGAYDPVGGYLLNHELDWAYMTMDMKDPRSQGFVATVDPQTDLPFAQFPEQLAPMLGSPLVGASGPKLPLENPHSWTRYVQKNPEVVRQCFA